VFCVEVGDSMLSIEHSDHDAKEDRDDRQSGSAPSC
jgi:hypothetical protein